MKLFNIVLTLTLAAMPAVAAANKHDNSKHGKTKIIFVLNEDESFYKNFPKSMTNLDDHYLVGKSNKLTSYSKSENHKQFSDDSFQSKFENKYKYSEGGNWSGVHKLLTGKKSNHFSHDSDNDDHNYSSNKGFSEYCKKSDWDNHSWGGHHGWENHHGWGNNHGSAINPAPVPEPTSYALMLAGLLLLGLNKRRSN